jgi:glycosyltransferase involved in cell wall biosynthesis
MKAIAKNTTTSSESVTPLWASLPRLVYLGDVPVESSYHGSALLFRLLQNWPVERLRVIEANLLRSLPERRLPGIQYEELQVGNWRLLHTRFARWYSAWLMRTRGGYAPVRRLLGDFRPEAVLTVTHGFSWLTAARFAAQHQLPLHLICHDDLPRTNVIPERFRPWIDGEFGRVYRQAKSRLCVSPFMCDAYLERYGAEGMVLYPSRSSDCLRFDTPPERIARNDHPFTVAFGGTINSPGYVDALMRMADALKSIRGQLLIFGPLTPEVARQAGLERPNIVLRGLVKSGELISRLREEADALFVPMSFAATDRPNMEISFPSKLTDYTAVGLPLLIFGPSYCSAVRWAQENQGVAEVVTQDSPELLATALRHLAQSFSYRIELGRCALEAGQHFFTCEAGQQVLYDAFSGQRPTFADLPTRVAVENIH